jgi:uncharacterized membrane protein YgcG
MPTSLFCIAVALAALAAGAREYQRPSQDRMLDWLVIAMPVLAYAWLTLAHSSSFRLEDLRAANIRALLPVALPLVYGLITARIGIQRRTHAPLIAAIACLICLAYELRAVTGLAMQWRLILWGSLALLASILLERYLRTPRNGITSRDVGEDLTGLDLAQIAGAASMTPASGGQAGQSQFKGGGGDFGGGGASGGY